MSDLELGDVLNFTEEDVLANRDGRLSESQRRLYFQHARRGLLSGMVVIVFFASMGSFMSMNGSVWLVAFIGISLASVVGHGGPGARRSVSARVNANRVECVSGQVRCGRTLPHQQRDWARVGTSGDNRHRNVRGVLACLLRRFIEAKATLTVRRPKPITRLIFPPHQARHTE
ncbi:MAG UNVERIFIED_CONTAM: hypothetical protein LVT10_11830 [Anaerolineae bacterium]